MATLEGATPSSQNSTEIESLARFAVEEHNKKEVYLLFLIMLIYVILCMYGLFFCFFCEFCENWDLGFVYLMFNVAFAEYFIIIFMGCMYLIKMLIDV